MNSYRSYLFIPLCLLLAKGCFAGTLVQFHILLSTQEYIGDLDVELFDKDKPVTVNNFLRLAEAGDYGNSFFHRLIPGFVLQGGGFFALNPYSTNVIAPPYGNLDPVPNFGNIPDEISVGPFHSNAYGTIAMAKAGAPGTANSQFFFNLANNSFLDSTNAANSGGYTVFGQVLRGTNILNFFNTFLPNDGLVDLTNFYGSSGITPNFVTLPNDVVSSNPPPYYDLVYFTISILSAQIQIQTNGSRQISWNTINGLTNNVEYATNLPPVSWQVLTNPVGTGAATNILDTSTNNTRRFYRIHVLY
jgi:peptidyl-prolyl cis-trans isomerase A (cyclophilin A)